MKTLTTLYFISLILVLIIIIINIFGNTTTLNTLYSRIKENKRIILVFLFSLIISVINLIENKYFSSLFTEYYYYYIFIIFLLSYIYWIIETIKSREINLFFKAVEKNLNFEEVFVYIMIITILFPIGSDIVRGSSKFPFELSVNLNNDFAKYTSSNNYINIKSNLRIQNNDSRIYNVKIETYGSMFRPGKYIDSIAQTENEQYLFFENKGIINSNSYIDLDLFLNRIFMPNFINNPIEIDSIYKIISGDTLISYTRWFADVQKLPFKNYSLEENYLNFKIKFPEPGIPYSFIYCWASKITISNNLGNIVYVFQIKGDLHHDLVLLLHNGSKYLAPGFFNESCAIKSKYLYNKRERDLSKDFFSCQYNNTYNKSNSLFKEDKATSIFYGEHDDNIILKTNSFPYFIYIHSMYLKDFNYYKQLIDNIKSKLK